MHESIQHFINYEHAHTWNHDNNILIIQWLVNILLSSYLTACQQNLYFLIISLRKLSRRLCLLVFICGNNFFLRSSWTCVRRSFLHLWPRNRYVLCGILCFWCFYFCWYKCYSFGKFSFFLFIIQEQCFLNVIDS